MKLAAARKLALALPEVTEQPHHELSSFRVRGKIFCTVPPDDAHLHVMLDEDEALAVAALHPQACEPLMWGSRVAGVRVALGTAPAALVRELIQAAYRRRAPAGLLAPKKAGASARKPPRKRNAGTD